jgi:hypothetical protein
MRILLIAAACAALAGCDGRTSSQPRVTVETARVQLPLARGRPGTAYFTLETNSRPMQLVGLSSPQVKRIELHDSRDDKGVMRMEKLDTLPFERDELAFEPGGKHAMLFGIAPSVKAGDRISLSFTFDPAPPVTVEAEVVAAGDAAATH